MALQNLNPDGLYPPQTFSHVVVATGTRMVFIAGQEPADENGELVGRGDLAAQARQVFGNLGTALAAAGARPDQVTRITIFVAGYTPDDIPVIEAARAELFGGHLPTDTLVGVQTLSDPGYLLEVDAIAVVD